ncbi:MAG: FtsW/RodA/SpoVE family cell cycle protein [Clostridia bacterium]|nr:FtsW/RodA/SpoVE family cell cycle protein [Clostridia bacterium]
MAQEKQRVFHWFPVMLLVGLFQIITAFTVLFQKDEFDFLLAAVLLGYVFIEFAYFFVATAFFNQKHTELEVIGFFLSGIGLTVCASVDSGYAIKQAVAILLGLLVFIVMVAVLRRSDIVMKLRTPVGILAIGLLALNIVLAETTNGTLNWIEIAGISVQPSEIVKLAFVFVGAASLDKLQRTRSITKYIIFAVVCVGFLFLMRDFGTALIFFFTFIIIAFMRSGDFRTIALICAGAVLGAIMIIYFKSTVAARFATYRHIWDDMYGKGMQQTRTLIYSASGGLFGLGIGKGKLKGTFASTTDLVFGMICEEWGFILALAIMLIFALLVIYAVKTARDTRSAFYAIAACAASGMLLFQMSLNIFGVTDLLPFTGVTLPFISRGGTSMLCSWGLLAFIKSADIHTYPRLSETILPDHPLYPDDIPVSKRRRRPAR